MTHNDASISTGLQQPHADATRSDLLLEARHINVEYMTNGGAVHAVNDVSFTLARGEILGLAGESGSGKSTLAYAITRLLRPPAYITGGEMLYHVPPRHRERYTDDCVDIFSLTTRQLQKFRWNELAIVFQSAMNALNPVTTLERQLTDVLQVHKPTMGRSERRQRALELLKLVGIAPERLTSYPHELSGGMRQRAIIAIALALQPEIIIMDEPTTALDVVVQREILKELMKLRHQFHFSIIFITHDLSLLLEMADTIAIMYAGRVIETAPAQTLYHKPAHPYTRGLLNSFPSLHGEKRRMTGIPGTPPDLRSALPGCAFSPRCPQAFAPCQSVQPLLQPVRSNSRTLAACHLYHTDTAQPENI